MRRHSIAMELRTRSHVQQKTGHTLGRGLPAQQQRMAMAAPAQQPDNRTLNPCIGRSCTSRSDPHRRSPPPRSEPGAFVETTRRPRVALGNLASRRCNGNCSSGESREDTNRRNDSNINIGSSESDRLLAAISDLARALRPLMACRHMGDGRWTSKARWHW